MIRFLVVSALLGFGFTVNAGPVEDEISARIAKTGTVCVEGESCASGSAGGATIAAADSGGAESNYKKTCATCHAAGIAGAPKFADKEQWVSRIAKGMDVLYRSSINGMPPAMPAKGMCFQCSDDELKAIVDYMVEAAQ